MALQPFVRPWQLFQFLNLYTVSMTPRTGDQPVASHRIKAYKTNIHVLSGIRTHDPSVLAGEDSSCLRLRGHCDRQCICVYICVCDIILVHKCKVVPVPNY
jgi:hypothetical protein